MMNHTYLTATTITIAQHNSDSTPKTEDVFSAMPWSGWNASFKAYSGLVPISPNTMPSTARISAGAECARRRFNAPQIGARIGWQIVPGAYSRGAGFPSRVIFVHRFTLRGKRSARWQRIDAAAVQTITGAQADGIKGVEHVQFGNTQAGSAIELQRTRERGGIQPAGAARPAGDRPEFMAGAREGRAGLRATRGI